MTLSPEGKSPDIRAAVIELQQRVETDHTLFQAYMDAVDERLEELSQALASALQTSPHTSTSTHSKPLPAPAEQNHHYGGYEWTYNPQKEMYAHVSPDGQTRFYTEAKLPEAGRAAFGLDRKEEGAE